VGYYNYKAFQITREDRMMNKIILVVPLAAIILASVFSLYMQTPAWAKLNITSVGPRSAISASLPAIGPGPPQKTYHNIPGPPPTRGGLLPPPPTRGRTSGGDFCETSTIV
jgi:hypothetical protein